MNRIRERDKIFLIANELLKFANRGQFVDLFKQNVFDMTFATWYDYS